MGDLTLDPVTRVVRVGGATVALDRDRVPHPRAAAPAGAGGGLRARPSPSTRGRTRRTPWAPTRSTCRSRRLGRSSRRGRADRHGPRRRVPGGAGMTGRTRRRPADLDPRRARGDDPRRRGIRGDLLRVVVIVTPRPHRAGRPAARRAPWRASRQERVPRRRRVPAAQAHRPFGPTLLTWTIKADGTVIAERGPRRCRSVPRPSSGRETVANRAHRPAGSPARRPAARARATTSSSPRRSMRSAKRSHGLPRRASSSGGYLLLIVSSARSPSAGRRGADQKIITLLWIFCRMILRQTEIFI